jgi:membrane associated rhomboid family serine protease
MLWSGDPAAGTRISKIIDRAIKKHDDSLSRRDREQIARLRAKLEAQEREGAGQFHAYQLLTHALLHGGLLHLAGNMLFMFVLGSRVNALIGNAKTAVIYPLLAIASGLVHHVAMSHEPYGAALGASGAIMGLAGMYLVLFPRNKVHMAAWFRLGPFLLALPFTLIVLFRFFFARAYKVFTVPGLFVVLFYIAFDIWDVSRGNDDGVAHWAHLGGFLAGVATALVLLLTRLVDARGGDLLSATLGRRAWALLGKPSARTALPPPPPPKPAVPVTSLDFPD